MGQQKAIISGYYGKGNAGDEALLLSLLQMLPDSITPIVLSANPTATKELYDVQTCPRRSLFPLFNTFQEANIFIWGGGSLIQDVTSLASPYYYLGIMKFAQELGLKTVAWAQGIGPLRAKITRQATQNILSHCTKVSVRDHRSAKLLHEWEIPFIVAPDPVWALNSKPFKGLWEIRAPRVAVSLRPSPYLTPQRLNNLTKALKDFQKATQASLLFIPFQPVQDLPLARQVTASLPGVSHIVSVADPRELKGLFQGVEMLIGMRYHSLIMAGAEGCRCFALSYDPKVSQLQKELNLPGWELDKLPDDPDLISTTWLQEYVNGESLNSNQIQSLVDRAFMHQQILSVR